MELEISVVISTFERPAHLSRCLASLERQRQVEGKFELIVVDDGSRDRTREMVQAFAAQARFPVQFATHLHDGYQLSRCRNAGIRLARAPYLLFTDGDCIFPPEHLFQHLRARKPGVVQAGDCVRLSAAFSEGISEDQIRSDLWVGKLSLWQRNAFWSTHLKSLFYQALNHPNKPRLVGNNIGAWRADLLAVNGFDERHRGWGCEDDDLALRLRQIGCRVETILGKTVGYHLWHPPHSTAPTRWVDGPNVAYFQRPLRLARCLEGLEPTQFEQLQVRVVSGEPHQQVARAIERCFYKSRLHSPDLELLFWPAEIGFAGDSSCRVLLTAEGVQPPKAVLRAASTIIRLPPNADGQSILQELRRRMGIATEKAGSANGLPRAISAAA